MRSKALQSEPHDSARWLKEIVDEYSNWKWQKPELLLGDLVEFQRSSSIRDIIEHLRKQTGEDLGDAPGTWIAKYSRPGHGEKNR
jgi:hypothetical protein